MESRLQQGNPLYLPCYEDRIRFRKNTRLQLWSMIRLLGQATRMSSGTGVPSVTSRGCLPASISYDGSCPQLDAGTDCTYKVGAGNMI